MKLSDQKGVALVEMAIILPLLVLLVFGVFEFARIMFIRNTLNFAAREGARRASISSPLDVSTVRSHVSNSLPVSLRTGLVVSVTPTAPAHGIDTVRVAVTTPFTPLTPLLFPSLIPITTLNAEASMLYE